jgi:predicted CoA-binding protein
MESRQVAVLGASPKPERYSNKAIRMLMEHGYQVIPINPAHAEIGGLSAVPRHEDLPAGSVDTVTVYMSAKNTVKLGPALIALNPRRVIFNPGAENPALADELNAQGIETIDACTLVLLRTGQY